MPQPFFWLRVWTSSPSVDIRLWTQPPPWTYTSGPNPLHRHTCPDPTPSIDIHSRGSGSKRRLHDSRRSGLGLIYSGPDSRLFGWNRIEQKEGRRGLRLGDRRRVEGRLPTESREDHCVRGSWGDLGEKRLHCLVTRCTRTGGAVLTSRICGGRGRGERDNLLKQDGLEDGPQRLPHAL